MSDNIVDYKSLGGIILAAGRGKRMNSLDKNKVTIQLANKPIVLHIVHFMQSLNFGAIIIVVGHLKESVQNVLQKENVIFAEQTEQLGTGDAVSVGIRVLPENIKNVFVVYGDDAVLYSKKQRDIIEKLLEKHFESQAQVTFLTIEQDDPFGLGRIIRNNKGELKAMVEEKDATKEQRKIKEINPGCFVFRVEFLKKYLPLIQKSPVTGEYYINSLIDLAIYNNEHVETLQGGKLVWRGVNTPEELLLAEKLFYQ